MVSKAKAKTKGARGEPAGRKKGRPLAGRQRSRLGEWLLEEAWRSSGRKPPFPQGAIPPGYTELVSRVAESLGVSRSYVHMLGRGDASPQLELSAEIEVLTGGEVPISSWLPRDLAARLESSAAGARR